MSIFSLTSCHSRGCKFAINKRSSGGDFEARSDIRHRVTIGVKRIHRAELLDLHQLCIRIEDCSAL